MKTNVWILVVVLALFSVGAVAQQQQATQVTPEQGLGVLWQATGSYKADRNEQALLQQCAATIEAALKIYRVYVPLTEGL